MLNITEIRKYIDVAVGIFLDKYPNVIVPPFVVCPASRRNIVREKVLKDCGLDFKEDDRGTEAEVITGPIATKILVYQSRIKTENMVRHCVWHELGHIVFGDEKQFNIDLEQDTPLRSGYALFNEFIAEYIAYTVNDFNHLSGSYLPNGYLSNVFYNGYCELDLYWLSRYYAIALGDETIDFEKIKDGEKIVPPHTWSYICQIMNMLMDQVEKEEYWVVDIEYLETIGSLYDQLFHVVFLWSKGILK